MYNLHWDSHPASTFQTSLSSKRGKFVELIYRSLHQVLEILYAAHGVTFPGIEVSRGIGPSGTLELVSPESAGKRIVSDTTQ